MAKPLSSSPSPPHPTGLARLLAHRETVRFIQFGVVGLSGVVVDMTLLYLLHGRLHWGLSRSKLVAAELAIINNFLWNDLWTFGDISRRKAGWKARLQRLMNFNAVCLVGLAINILLLNLFFNFLNMHYLVANGLAIALVMVWNFGVNRAFNWR